MSRHAPQLLDFELARDLGDPVANSVPNTQPLSFPCVFNHFQRRVISTFEPRYKYKVSVAEASMVSRMEKRASVR